MGKQAWAGLSQHPHTGKHPHTDTHPHTLANTHTHEQTLKHRTHTLMSTTHPSTAREPWLSDSYSSVYWSFSVPVGHTTTWQSETPRTHHSPVGGEKGCVHTPSHPFPLAPPSNLIQSSLPCPDLTQCNGICHAREPFGRRVYGVEVTVHRAHLAKQGSVVVRSGKVRIY